VSCEREKKGNREWRVRRREGKTSGVQRERERKAGIQPEKGKIFSNTPRAVQKGHDLYSLKEAFLEKGDKHQEKTAAIKGLATERGEGGVHWSDIHRMSKGQICKKRESREGGQSGRMMKERKGGRYRKSQSSVEELEKRTELKGVN